MGEDKRTISFSVAGRPYRVVTSANEDEIRSLAATVDERLRAIAAGRQPGVEALVLTAISLAHDAAAHRHRAEEISQGARKAMGRMLDRIDTALATSDTKPTKTNDGP